MDYSNCVRAVCHSKNYPITKLERECGFTQGTIHRWNKTIPQIDKFEKVADVLGCSIDELCGRAVPENTVFIEKSARSLNAEYTDDDYNTLPDADRLQVMNLLMRLKFKNNG